MFAFWTSVRSDNPMNERFSPAGTFYNILIIVTCPKAPSAAGLDSLNKFNQDTIESNCRKRKGGRRKRRAEDPARGSLLLEADLNRLAANGGVKPVQSCPTHTSFQQWQPHSQK